MCSAIGRRWFNLLCGDENRVAPSIVLDYLDAVLDRANIGVDRVFLIGPRSIMCSIESVRWGTMDDNECDIS